jgi:hypothetical protein
MEAQSSDFYVTKTGMPVDPNYIKDSGERFLFKPFNANSYQSLESAFIDGKVAVDTELMVFEVAGQTLTLIKKQMAYHHVAQGRLNGEAWAAFF